jgi:NDP-sugar pyrophosphorylase family protein
MTAYILAAGAGVRMAPYGECHPKTLLPIANKPLLDYLCDALDAARIDRIVIAAAAGESDIRNQVANRGTVSVVPVGRTSGTAMSLLAALRDDDAALVFYGDVLLGDTDVKKIANALSPDRATLLLTELPPGDCRDWITASIEDGQVSGILGHPREGVTHRIAGFALPANFRSWLEACPTYFPSLEVGMMPPAEHHLEAAVETYRAAGNPVAAVQTAAPSIDLDKPWHILEANLFMVESACGALTANELADGASIHESASIDGFVRLGKESRVGRNVIIRGNLIVGDNTEIDGGAIINGNTVIGNNCFVGNACFIEGGSAVGDNCVVSHAAELAGVIFRGVYLYHYMEIYGVVGENSDIGAGTVCGSLRFDDGATVHKIRGRRELPRNFSNATFIGDYCRTGVNATIMPGKKIGPYSLVGAGVLLENDVPPRTGVSAQQSQERFAWGPERYGW